MSYGKLIRLSRILDLKSGKSIIFPIDHGGYMGPIKGLENPWNTLKTVLDTQCVDSLLLHKGLVKRYYRELSEYTRNVGIILRISATYMGSEKVDYEELIATCHEAIILGADAVAFTIYVGGKRHNDIVKLFGRIVDECDSLGIPILGECLPSPELGNDLNAVRTTVRIGAELGADMIKTIYVEPFEEVVDVCPVPIVVAGGAKRSDIEVLKMVKKAINAGAAGVCIGRNVFQHKNPDKMIKAIAKIVKENANLETAMKVLRE